MRRSVSSTIAGCCALVLVTAGHAAGQAIRTTRVSVSTTGVQGDSDSGIYGTLAVSADGRYVAFSSFASNLVPGDTNVETDVFLHDRQTQTTTRVSVATGGGQGNGRSYVDALSADGRYVAFTSNATTLVPGDANRSDDVFVHDRQTATTTRVSVASGGTEGHDSSYGGALSADGRYVAFTSDADNLVVGDTNGTSDVFVHDCVTGATTRVSIATSGAQGSDFSAADAISADGRHVVFSSLAADLVADDTNGRVDVFVHDRHAGTTTRVSVASGGGQADGDCSGTSVSADARHVVLDCSATNLVPGDTNGQRDAFVHDRQAGTTTRVSVASDGGQANDRIWRPTISPDGRFVAFDSPASNLVPNDTNGARDVFLHDRETGTTRRVSLGSAGAECDGSSGLPALSGYASQVAFASYATNLVPGDTNSALDVFVAARGAPPNDFDADGLSDPTVFRPSIGTWFELRSRTGSAYGVSWGVNGDTPVPGDYDGDGIADPAVFRPSSGTWFVLQSTTGTGVGVPWGLSDDVPVPADYDGDGKTDVAVWRPSTGVWFIIGSSTNTAIAIAWGVTNDVPVPADFDGDGKADPTVFRPSSGMWYQLRSTTAVGYGLLWGENGDLPLAGDYDGDGKADPTVFRASMGTWYELRSTTGAGYGVMWGTLGDVPIVGDYDADGKMDPTVFRPSTNTWYQLRSTTGTGYGMVWGATGDLPQ